MTDTVLELRGVGHWFGETKVLHDVNLKVIRGEIVSLVGPSGCGKSTLLRAALGTHPPRAGEVLMYGTPVSSAGRDRARPEPERPDQDRPFAADLLDAFAVHARPVVVSLNCREMLRAVN